MQIHADHSAKIGVNLRYLHPIVVLRLADVGL